MRRENIMSDGQGGITDKNIIIIVIIIITLNTWKYWKRTPSNKWRWKKKKLEFVSQENEETTGNQTL